MLCQLYKELVGWTVQELIRDDLLLSLAIGIDCINTVEYVWTIQAMKNVLFEKNEEWRMYPYTYEKNEEWRLLISFSPNLS